MTADVRRHVSGGSTVEPHQYVGLTTRIFPLLILLDGQQNETYAFSERNIAWGGLAKQYAATPGYSSPADALPPPNWAEQYPDGYTDATGFPNLAEDEHFQVWMRVAAFPTFRKLWGRNDDDVMTAGTYRILINMSASQLGRNDFIY